MDLHGRDVRDDYGTQSQRTQCRESIRFIKYKNLKIPKSDLTGWALTVQG